MADHLQVFEDSSRLGKTQKPSTKTQTWTRPRDRTDVAGATKTCSWLFRISVS